MQFCMIESPVPLDIVGKLLLMDYKIPFPSSRPLQQLVLLRRQGTAPFLLAYLHQDSPLKNLTSDPKILPKHILFDRQDFVHPKQETGTNPNKNYVCQCQPA